MSITIVVGAACALAGFIFGRWTGVQSGYVRATLDILNRMGK